MGTIDVNRTKNFYKEFNKIQNKNLRVTNTAEKLYGNIDKLHNIRLKLDENISNEETKLKNTLTEFETNYGELQRKSGRDPRTGRPKAIDPTFDAQRKIKKITKKSRRNEILFLEYFSNCFSCFYHDKFQ